LEIVRWEDPKVNGKIKMDVTEIACDVDKLMAVALKRQFP
jgi:metal-sulfur cluster biosynthetic enzyme